MILRIITDAVNYVCIPIILVDIKQVKCLFFLTEQRFYVTVNIQDATCQSSQDDRSSAHVPRKSLKTCLQVLTGVTQSFEIILSRVYYI